MEKLHHKTILYIPMEYGDERTVPSGVGERMIKNCVGQLVDLAGGTTMLDGIGYWKKNGRINAMETKLIVTYVEDLVEATEVLKSLALYVKEETQSEAICYEVDNQLFIL